MFTFQSGVDRNKDRKGKTDEEKDKRQNGSPRELRYVRHKTDVNFIRKFFVKQKFLGDCHELLET